MTETNKRNKPEGLESMAKKRKHDGSDGCYTNEPSSDTYGIMLPFLDAWIQVVQYLEYEDALLQVSAVNENPLPCLVYLLLAERGIEGGK